MEDISEKINSILSDPDAMSMIQSIAASLGSDGGNEHTHRQGEQANQIDVSQIASIVDALNSTSNEASQDKGGSEQTQGDGIMQALLRIMPLLNRLNYDDDRIKLLHALRPLVSEERRERVDYAEKLIRLMALISQAGGF